MLLQELYNLAESLEEQEKLPPAYHKAQKVRWFIDLDLDGKLLGVSPTGEKPISLTAPFLKRTIKSVPMLLIDKVSYVLGAELESLDLIDGVLQRVVAEDAKAQAKQEQQQERLELFRAQLQELIDAAQQAELIELPQYHAVMAFLDDNASRDAVLTYLLEPTHKATSGDNLAFRVDGELIHRHRFVKSFWEKAQDEANAQGAARQGLCMLTNEHGPIARVHPTEVRLGPNPVSLISANSKPFESYGLSQSEVAPLGLRPARLYGEALKYLINDKAHSYRVGEVTYLFWRKSLADPVVPSLLDNPLALFGDSAWDQDEGDVRLALKRIFAGGEGDLSDLDADIFYGAAISSNSSRLVVRDTITQSVSQVIDHLAQWFERQSLIDSWSAPARVAPQSVYWLAASTCRDVKDISPRLVPALIRSALYGTPLPLDLLQRALLRAAADPEKRLPQTRAVLVRLVLNDHLPQGAQVEPELHRQDTRPAYLCGRLFALLESAQYAALGQVNATIADRFYGTASTSPATVFPRLLRGAQAHLQKLRKRKRGAFVSIDKEIESIMSGLDGFPRTLSLMNQGLFAMGYYHQRAEMTRRIAEYKFKHPDDALEPEDED